MTATTHLDPYACASCRLRFPTSAALRRHDELDHRPAPDGALLTAQVLGPLSSGAAPAAPSTRSVWELEGAREVAWRLAVLLVVVLLAVASVSVPAATVLLLLAFWARARIGPGVSAAVQARGRSSARPGTASDGGTGPGAGAAPPSV